MLSDEERREIESEIAHFPTKRAVCIDALRIVQHHRGWLSDEALEDIGPILDMTTAELDGICTFENLLFRKPVGRHIILVCDSITCWIMGYNKIRDHLRARLGVELGQTTPDGLFTLLPVVCLGACDHAPAMMIDDTLYGDLDEKKINDLLAGFS
jgi:NADH-quinone oxidoreductase subunit E